MLSCYTLNQNVNIFQNIWKMGKNHTYFCLLCSFKKSSVFRYASLKMQQIITHLKNFKSFSGVSKINLRKRKSFINFWESHNYFQFSIRIAEERRRRSRTLYLSDFFSSTEESQVSFEDICKWKSREIEMSSMGYNDARLANSTTGIYLQRSFNIEPPSARFMPGVGRAKNYSERLRMGKDCDEVYPGIIIGKSWFSW